MTGVVVVPVPAPAAAVTPKKPVAKVAKKPKAVGVKKAAKAPAHHPQYTSMVGSAIQALKEHKGSSRQAILKYIMANFKVGNDAKLVNSRIKVALRRCLKLGLIKHSKGGTGASGSFRLGEKKAASKKPKPVKVKKPASAAKPKKAASPKKPKSPSKSSATKPKKAKSPKNPKAPKSSGKSKVHKPKSPKKAAKPKVAKKAAPKKAAPVPIA